MSHPDDKPDPIELPDVEFTVTKYSTIEGDPAQLSVGVALSLGPAIRTEDPDLQGEPSLTELAVITVPIEHATDMIKLYAQAKWKPLTEMPTVIAQALFVNPAKYEPTERYIRYQIADRHYLPGNL